MRGVTKARKVFFGPKASVARCWLFAGILLGLLMPVVQAQSIQWRSATLAVVDDSWTTNADFDIELSPRMEEVLGNGVALYFVAELELTRPRWYWLDERVLSERLTMRLGYQPLLRQ
jgi:hypothetical protein